jgi:hypothetical protein
MADLDMFGIQADDWRAQWWDPEAMGHPLDIPPVPELTDEDRAWMAGEREAAELERRMSVVADRAGRWAEQIPLRYRKPADPQRPGYPYGELRAWAAARPLPNLVMVGDNLKGKTFAAWHLVLRALQSGAAESAVFCSSDMWREIAGDPSVYHRDHSRYAEGDARRAGILVLDDIARAGWKADHDPGVLYGIVSERVDWQRPTIVTSNNKNLRDTFGKAVTKRLEDEIGGSPGVVIDFGTAADIKE